MRGGAQDDELAAHRIPQLVKLNAPAFSVLLVALSVFSPNAGAQSGQIIRVPGETEELTLRWLQGRKARQEQAARRWEVFHGFSFSDALARSGITFRQRAVDEASRNFKPNHYDHGTAVAAADVDQDRRTDLFFVNQRGGSELWRNAGGGKFENITATSGVGLADKIGVAASFGDIDNDGLPDLFVTTVNMGNHLFHNEGGGRFKDISVAAGMTEKGHSSGAVFFDYNRDGLLDLFVCNVGVYTGGAKGADGAFPGFDDAFTGFLKPERLETSVLYKNLGGLKFANAGPALKFQHREWSGDAAFCDLDGTGFPGLYVLSMSGWNAYYRNDRGLSFVDETRPKFGRAPWGAMGIKFFDANQDGRQDLFVTDMHSDMNTLQLQIGATNRSEAFAGLKSDAWCSAEWVRNRWPGASTNFLFGNAFYRNGTNGFSEVSDRIGAETYWPWGVSVGDANADGFEDVFVTAGMGYPMHYWMNSLLLNEGGKGFRASEFLLGLEPRPGNQVLYECFSLECGGADKGHALCQGQGGQVRVLANSSSRSSVFLDWDDDGDLDLAVQNMNEAPLMMASDLSEKRAIKWLKVRLKGTVSNRDGLGATVKVMTQERVWTQFHDGKSGYLAQSSVPLYFGLGSSTEVKGIEVAWPSGIRQSLGPVALNQTLEIVEPR